ncbi:MAG: hypothetical protein ABMA26_06180 [Limisphaerales bacterium]
MIGRIEFLATAQTWGRNDDDEMLIKKKLTPEVALIVRFLDEWRRDNPFALCAALWALRPKLFDLGLHRPIEEFITPWTGENWACLELGIPTFPPGEFERMEGLLKEDISGNSFPGPLLTTDGSFNLDTSWPDTPPLFRFHFEWLWAEFDPSLAGINQRPFIPCMFGVQPAQSSGPVTTTIDWTFLDRLLEPSKIDLILDFDLQDLRKRFENHHLFGVPKAPLTKQERCILKKEFGKWLDEVNTEHGTATSTNKAGGLFGNPVEWRDFIWCRHWIHYPQESMKPKTPAQLGMHKRVIFKDWAKLLKPNGKIKKGDNPVSAIAGRYKKIESLMFKVYPCFNWAGIQNDRLGVPESVTRPFQERALEVCRRKLKVGFVANQW